MNKTIVIAGGGTGGHIYPGVAIARALLQQDTNIQIIFVGSHGGLEEKIIPREKFKLHLISGGKLNFSGQWMLKLKTLIKLPMGLIESVFLLNKYKPDFVLGVGGYASGPFVMMATLLGYRTAVWEANAHPGLANRLLSKLVKTSYVVFDESRKSLSSKNILNFGMPVRSEIENSSASLSQTEKRDGKFHILSFGGSQGSRAISKVLSDAILARGPWTSGVFVIHQIGSTDWSIMQKKYEGAGDLVEPVEFIYDMPNKYAWSDLVIARGGASTIMELAAFGVVPIIIPLPAADNHQQHNAESLVKNNAGRMILQSDLTVENLIKSISELRDQPQKMLEMKNNIKKLFKPKASEKIALDILSQIGNS